MNSKQRENLAKYSYDLSKIVFAILVIGPLTRPGEMSIRGLVFALIGALTFLVSGLFLDKER